jgi:hypothetical protein
MTHRRYYRALDAAVLLACLGIIPSLALAADDAVDGAITQQSAAEASTEQVGWIRKNATHPDVDAPYSLVDTGGMIRCYIRPARGIDMERYLNRKVRVRGAEINVGNDPTAVLEVSQVGPPDAPLPPLAGWRNDRPADRSVNRAGFINNRQQPVEEEVPTPATGQPPGASLLPDNPDLRPAEPPDGHAHADGDDDDLLGQVGPTCQACGGCGHASCATCCHGFCGPPGRFWVRVEYLYWFTEGMRIPPLVTTGPDAGQPGYLGVPGTTILYGGDRVDGYGRSGGRLTVGTWLNCAQTVGLEGEFFALQTGLSSFSATSMGSPILSRPYYDTATPTGGGTVFGPSVEQVASPGVIAGTVSANTYTRLSSAGARLRFNLCCSTNCYANSCLPWLNGPGANRLDFIVGYRYLNLSDGVSVTENLTNVAQPIPGVPAGAINVNDTFTSRNQFNGAEFGTVFQAFRGNRFSLEVLQKIALGNNNEFVSINGYTTTVPAGGIATTLPGGLLAQSTNIGRYTRNEFAVIPEFGATLGYQLTPRLRATLGYTFLYFSRVSRAGDQIDLNVNSTLLPNSPGPQTGDVRHPLFAFQDTDFWAQGINAGIDYRF